jgi:hypothetical protein
MSKLIRIDEEVARFSFEVHLRERCPSWFVAFTNPTAGPWKRILAPDSEGNCGEVHRFEQKALRPDLVIVNDNLQVAIIIEAKDDLAKLGRVKQADNSIEAARSVAEVLGAHHGNRFWGTRADFPVVFGLLWGSTGGATDTQVNTVFELYCDRLESIPRVVDTVIGIESGRHGEDGPLTCKGQISPGGTTESHALLNAILDDLAL